MGGTAEEAPTDETLRVTSDSPEYCRDLAERLSRDATIVWTADLRSLADMGRDLCRTGHVKMGISRLRTVWMLGHSDK